MSGRPKNQHWVPRFYLKHFATPETRGGSNPQVWFIDKTKAHSQPELASTKRICGQNYLYTPVSRGGDRDWSFEEYLSRIEGIAAGYWHELATGRLDLSDFDVRSQVAEFLAALHLRNKLVFDLNKGIMEKRDALFGGPTLDKTHSATEPDEARPDPTHPGRFFVQSTRRNIPRIKKTFFSYRWTLLACKLPVLVTSDAPVTFINSIRRRSGPGSKNAKAVFPISPSTMLYIENSDAGPETMCQEVDADYLEGMNPLIEHFAERFVILGDKPRKKL